MSVLRRVAFVTSAVFSWMALSPGNAAAASEVRTLTTRPTGHQRALSLAERTHIFGANFMGLPAADPNAGAPHPWQGQSGGASTSSRNKLTSVPIVGWSGRGPGISLSLYNSSYGSTNAIFGPKWTMSYNVYLAHNDVDDNLQVVEGSGPGNLFTANISGTYSAPPGVHDTLAAVSGGYNLTRKDRSVWHFNSAYFLTSITDRNGNAVTLAYDSQNHLLSVTDAVGRALTFGWNSAKTRILSVTDPTSRVWTMSYDGSARLASVTEPTLGSSSVWV